MWEIQYHRKVKKDILNLKQAKLDKKAKELIEILRKNPYINPPPYEKLIGNLNGAFSRRINIQHRLVYTINTETKIIKILSMWSHYE